MLVILGFCHCGLLYKVIWQGLFLGEILDRSISAAFSLGLVRFSREGSYNIWPGGLNLELNGRRGLGVISTFNMFSFSNTPVLRMVSQPSADSSAPVKRRSVLPLIFYPQEERVIAQLHKWAVGSGRDSVLNRCRNSASVLFLFPLLSWLFWALACIGGARSPGTTFPELFAGQVLDSSLPIRDTPTRMEGIKNVETMLFIAPWQL